MKTKLLSLVCAVFAAYTVNATVRTVANFPPGSAQYPDVQTAINAASNGDTIYVNGSPTTYNTGGLTITKRLVFVGVGYADSAEGSLNSIIGGNVVLDTTGSTIPYSGSYGCQFMGIWFSGSVHTGQYQYGDGYNPKNIFFSGCGFTNRLDVENDGWIIQNCFFGESDCDAGIDIYYTPINSCIIENNFFSQPNCYTYCLAFNQSTLANGLIIDHNFFEGYLGGSIGAYAIISNNVFFFASAISSNTVLQNCQISNNLFYSGTKDSLTNDVTGATGNNVFNNYIEVANNYQFNNTLAAIQDYPNVLSYNWKLLNTSAGHNAATDNTDCGPFGGSYPINMNGSPIPPQMFQMNTSSLVPINDTLKVQFEARQQKQ